MSTNEKALRRKMKSEEIQAIFDAVIAQGWRWRNGGKHIVVYPADRSHKPLILSLTAFDGPGTKNTRGQFRRAGLRI